MTLATVALAKLVVILGTVFGLFLATVLPGETADLTVIWVSGLPWAADMTQLQTYCANPEYYLGI